jgi:hypothetical protein
MYPLRTMIPPPPGNCSQMVKSVVKQMPFSGVANRIW